MRLAKNKSKITRNAFLFEHFGSGNAFPCSGNFDKDAGFVYSSVFVESNDGTAFGNGGFGVEGEAGIYLGGYVARDYFGYFDAKVYC